MFKSKMFFLLLVAVITLISSNSAMAQNSISSPYSRFGIGDVNVFNNAINNAMGGVGYAYRKNNSINLKNPASYSRIDTTSFVFDIGFYSEYIRLNTNTAMSEGNNTNISHILVGFPLGKKFDVVLGLQPFSYVDFISSETVIDSVLGRYEKTYAGDGGLNNFIIGLAYAPIENLSFGVNFEYVFGNYYKGSTSSFPDSSYMTSSRREKNSHIRAFDFNIGAQYFQPLRNGDKIGIGLVYDFISNYPTKDIEYFYTFVAGTTSETILNEIYKKETDNNITFPSSFGAGLSYERDNNFFIGLDGKYTYWDEFEFNANYVNTNLRNNILVSLGGEWKPDAYGSFFEKAVYRIGVSYDNGMLVLRDQRIDQFTIGCGMGIPIKKANTMINLSLEYSNRGTVKSDLIRENYFRIGLSFSAKDLWFFKRKYQ